MRHWRRHHTQLSSVFPCLACCTTFEAKPDLRDHLRRYHGFLSYRARSLTANLQRVHVPNNRFINPDGALPPIYVRRAEVVEGEQEVAEGEPEVVEGEPEIVEEQENVEVEDGEDDLEEGEIIQIGDMIPRDVDVKMVKRNGEYVFVKLPLKDFQGP